MAKQVLVIDDDHSVVKYLSVLLSEHGYEPASAFNGDEGMRKIEQALPDLIVLDVMMPKRSGLVMFQQLKKNERFKDIPILMLTGVAQVLAELESQKDDTHERPYDNLRESLKGKIKELRLDGEVKPEMFVDKPVEPDTFISKVQELIGS